MNWRIKPFMQNLISCVPEPYSESLNQFISRRFGGLRALTAESAAHCLRMAAKMQQYGGDPKGCDVLEIGTGWSCLGSLALAQFATRRIDTIDLYRHVREDMVRQSVRYLLENAEQLKLPRPPRGLDPGASQEEILSRAGIVYSAPLDLLTMTGSGRYDAVYSIAVFEHVPAGLLPGLVDATRRLLKPGGLAYHVVTPADHFSWSVGGRALGPYNFLKYSSRWFNFWYNPRISHQNRWRCSQYVGLFQHAGFDVLDIERDITPDRLRLLDKMKIAAEFQRFDRDDLATEQFYILLRKAM
jgi:cyclopropane fatty-acyl-phospholipid synthase-like methyltransferase